MSQFAARIDQKDEKLPLKKEEKVVILTEKDICKEDLRELHRNATVCAFDAEIQFDSNINNLLEKFDVLIIDVRIKKDLHWYQLMRSAVEKREDVNIVYLHQKGVPITTRDHLKQNLAVDYIVKELPQKGDYLDKADFFFKLLSDHIPLQRNYFAVAKSLFSCLFSCVNDDDEQKKSKK